MSKKYLTYRSFRRMRNACKADEYWLYRHFSKHIGEICFSNRRNGHSCRIGVALKLVGAIQSVA